MTTHSSFSLARRARLLSLPLIAALVGAPSDLAAPKAGEWEIGAIFSDVVFSDNIPAPKVDGMRQMIAEGLPPSRECLDRPLDVAEGLLRVSSGNDCQMDRYDMAGGQLTVAMHCSDGTDSMAMSFAGSYSTATIDLAGTVNVSQRPADGEEQTTTLSMQVTGRRIGDCSEG